MACIEKHASDRSCVPAFRRILRICGTVAPTLRADATMDKKIADILPVFLSLNQYIYMYVFSSTNTPMDKKNADPPTVPRAPDSARNNWLLRSTFGDDSSSSDSENSSNWDSSSDSSSDDDDGPETPETGQKPVERAPEALLKY